MCQVSVHVPPSKAGGLVATQFRGSGSLRISGSSDRNAHGSFGGRLSVFLPVSVSPCGERKRAACHAGGRVGWHSIAYPLQVPVPASLCPPLSGAGLYLGRLSHFSALYSVGTEVHYWIRFKTGPKAQSVSCLIPSSTKGRREGEQPDDDMLLLHSADQDCAAAVPPCLVAECLPLVVHEDGIADGSTETAQRTHAFSVGMNSHTEYL
ncbi:hypothetical protein CSHISOI_00090 [Colletotrichum shisoi]|uniref:Uncharacterized protein n=1 Tax=Colletotrichum shisoi TaxID=2078593 RepID=A0A5Q4CCH7_9PEZI|nr:hypothetical protein CSHISOI_00090 [Colletotrichum shisoi]